MSPFIKDASVQAVLAAAGIVDVISGYTSLRKRGATYTGLCPFHQEKTPSFTVSAEKGLYYCFGCGEGGDVVRFLERAENLSFVEAIEQLGERFGVPVEFEAGAGPDAARKDRESRLLLLLDKAATFYQRFLWETESGRAALDYLEKRGLGEEVCRAFRVGFSPDEWRGLKRRATKEGFTDRELEEAGLLVRQTGKTYDRFRGRLMFPLVDHRGRVLGFGGRTLKDETPKYLNSPEGPLYQKGRLLYGLYQARRAVAEADEVIVVEGYTDVLGLVQVGVGNVVASMGTALTDAQIGLMLRFTGNVTFMFDADRAGTDAMLRSGELARGHSLRPMVALLPGGRDPADLAVSGGPEAVTKVTAGKVSLLGFELRQALARGDTSTADGRVRAFEDVRRIMGRVSSLKEREEEIPLVADRLRLSPDSVALLLRGGRAPSRSDAVRGGRETAMLTRRLLGSETAVERDFLVAAACNPERAVDILGALTPEHFADLDNREVFAGLREALALMTGPGDHEAAFAKLRSRAHDDSSVGPLFVRLVMEADQGRYSVAVLDELCLRLQEQYLKREIGALRATLDDGEDRVEEQKRLVRLERLLQSVRANLKDLDPEEGRT
ncbi:MAG: DNA primase [Actinobacteria bacterium]|nr:DNA primase [Actinomycetota bacterium]